ncbi:MAG TPA: glycosyltransferase family 2 protein [Candidatus Norongarragalinales archaeon]|jgi:cellulose synthase/poly-beta-1,6-N-acetylglucosamine synthase-like glycosyltransferase|nr:glycosyltransferase family 2 protein [Candidatus Norongarragalinales archaeon]
MASIPIIEYAIGFFTLYITVFFLLVYLENRSEVKRHPQPPKKLPSFTIIIPAYNEQDSIERTVQSVLDSGYPRAKMQVIVVDDGSRDATWQRMQKFKRTKGVLLLRKPNGGKAAALNFALKRAKGEFIATLDSDCFVEKGAIQKMLGYFWEDDKIMAVTSVTKVENPRNAVEKLQRIEYLVSVFARRVQQFIDAIAVTPGPLSVYRARVFKELGGFDEKSVLEDQEMGFRIQSNHYKIRGSMDAVVHTTVPPTFKMLLLQRVRWYRGGLRNVAKYKHMLSRDYGDLGMFVMPLGIVSMLMMFVIFGLSLLQYSHGASAIDLITRPSVAWLGIQATHIIAVVIFALSAFWVYLGMKHFEGEALTPLYLLLYLIIYAPMVTLFWIATLIYEAKGGKPTWLTR